MKPGIYLIEVKECEICKGLGAFTTSLTVGCRACDTRGYTETRIDAEAWLLSMLERLVVTTPTLDPNISTVVISTDSSVRFE